MVSATRRMASMRSSLRGMENSRTRPQAEAVWEVAMHRSRVRRSEWRSRSQVSVLGGVAAGGVGEGELGQDGCLGLGEEFGEGGAVEGGHWARGRWPPGYQVEPNKQPQVLRLRSPRDLRSG